jgi:rapamycin-insensitive companion of mTOR
MDVEKFIFVCIPNTSIEILFSAFSQMPPWEPPPERERNEPTFIPPTNQQELEVITAIQNLANTVIANAASRSLAKYVVHRSFT